MFRSLCRHHVHARHVHACAQITRIARLTCLLIRVIGVAANCTYRPRHNWTRAKRRRDTIGQLNPFCTTYNSISKDAHSLRTVGGYLVHYTRFTYTARMLDDVRNEKILRQKQRAPSVVILKGFNAREWKFILRSGYERLIRDKLPRRRWPRFPRSQDVQDTFSCETKVRAPE